uniref:Uncharacterized protein n=1 Tax=Arundo donax TaxID=35708 RepID=A0A0A9E1E6_ARUDO
MHQALWSQYHLDLQKQHHMHQKKKVHLQSHYVEGTLKTDYIHPIALLYGH